ncbi:RE1 [Symbiodinium microadriaticum]|nr:RE1 [Symbiodinium microadriaticum]
MESKLEPEYDRDGRDEGFDDNGLQASEGSATVERLPGGEMPELGSRRPAEDRHEEQEAADLLAQAEDLEPEYDFESAEGGVASPGQDDQLLEADQEGIAGLGRRPGLRVQGGQAVSQILEADSAREAGRRSLRPEEATRTLNGTAGQGKGSGGASSLAGWEEAGFTMQASARPPGDTSTWSIYGGRISEEARMETLETLVQQLLEQNERLKREPQQTVTKEPQPNVVTVSNVGNSVECQRAGPQLASYKVNASPATPGGTKVPREGDAKDFRPGERTLWELPVLAPVGEALPSALYEQALSVRSVSCTCMLLLAMRMYQPGGLSERSELLKGLTGLAMCDNAVTAVAVLQKWFRHLERARTMEISVPDSSLLLDGVDKCMKGILQANPNLQFRIQNIRMHLQLDTAPTLETVEEYTRTLLAEMELLSVSAPDPTSKRQRIAAVGVDQDKGAKGQKGGKGGDGTQQSSAGNGRGAKGDRKLCSAWSTENGCPQGKLCQLAHTPEKPGACWVCGGPHQKFECKAPGGGKAPKLDGNSGAGADDSGAKPKKGKPKGNEAKGNPKSAATPSRGSSGSAGQTSGISEAAIKEAAQILQSLRLSAIRCDLKSASEILSKATERGRRGLIDGGATACLRTAHSSERSLPTISVRLAYGSCDLHINQYGTLLSEVPVSPIISVKALLRLGYRIDWNASRCRVYHPKFGDLEVDTSTGCPEVNEGVALELIDQYELYVGRQDTVGARLRCIMEDLRDTGNHDLLKVIHSGGSASDLKALWCMRFVGVQGPFAKGRDEHTSKARYLIVGVLSVPILAVDGKEVDDPNDADPEPAPADAGGAIEDAEWFADGGVIEAEAEDELSLRETAEARTAWNEWDRLVKSSREDWIQDAQSEKLPKVEIVDFVYVEAIERKTHGEVLTAIGRMHARAKAEGFDVRRLHSDRGREYNNKPLRDWCARHAVHKTLAVAEEHQGNGRAEGAIMRVKSKTRTILEESASEKSDWPLAAKLAAHELKNAARKRLKLEMQQSLPFDTKVQVISRSWKRETWESRTTTAWVKCPSADMSRGWVVATEDGKLLTTGKLFPSVEQGKVSFSSTGPAVDVDAPERRVTGKRAIRLLQSSLLREPTHGADKLAKKLFEDNLFRPRDLAALAVQVSQLTQDSNRMVKPQETGRDEQRRTCNFLTGAFTYGGMTGLRSNTKDHPWVTRYLTAYMSKYASGLFAGVGLILNVDHVLHRDVHNQKGVPNIVLPVVTSGGGLWIQESENQVSSECVLGPVSAKVLPNTRQATGRVCEYRSHKAIKFHPNLWHESVSAHGQQLLLVGYTPRSLHKLTSLDRDMLGQTGFTLLPASKEEFWGYSHAEDILTRQGPGCVPDVDRSLKALQVSEGTQGKTDEVPGVSLQQEISSDCNQVTVSEEFPSNCPQSVALKCLSIELRRLQKLLYEEDKAQLMRDRLGETVIPDESIESWAWFRVPWQACGLQPCPDTVIDASEQVELCGVGWPMKADVSGALNEVAAQHLKVCSLLQTVEEDNSEQVCSSVDKIYWNALDALERQGCELQGYESQLLNSANSVVLRSLSAIDSETPVDEGELVKAEGLAQDGEGLSDPPPLQTKIIGADQVRREPEKWIPSMTEEYQSLVSRTGAVQELSDSAYKQLMEDPTVVLEVIPGKLVYVHKSSGRRKSRIVGCGNFCQGGSNERNELYASGAGAEALRLMVRKCTLCPGWVLASVDVRTAFLQAPLLEQQREGKRLITIVRVPSILRETGVTTCKFWRVQKALYGLASAPRSWSNYRDKVLSELRIPCGSDVLQLVKMVEDANLLHIIRVSSEGDDSSAKGWKAGVVALYVDDILIGAERPVCEAVIKALQDQWELSSPEWIANPGDQMKFAGYELQKTREGIRLHQESYTQDLIEQNEEVVTGTERTPAVKMVGFDEVTDEDERRDLVKRSQCLIGQLLWLAGRTRPDLAYGVSMAAQKIASCPREALARAEHLVKYLRGSVGASLHYKAADGKCGRWDQLRHRQTDCTLDVYTDASFAADEQCRSFGSVHLYWGGALVSWAAARQTLIAAHTAESELYSLSEGHLMGKAFRPTVAALMDIDEKSVQCHLYCDNMAAVQLCTLEVRRLVETVRHVDPTPGSLRGIPVISARTVEEPAVVQPDRQGASGVMIPLNDGSLVPLEEATYEDVREAYYADLRDAFVQAGTRSFDEVSSPVINITVTGSVFEAAAWLVVQVLVRSPPSEGSEARRPNVGSWPPLPKMAPSQPRADERHIGADDLFGKVPLFPPESSRAATELGEQLRGLGVTATPGAIGIINCRYTTSRMAPAEQEFPCSPSRQLADAEEEIEDELQEDVSSDPASALMTAAMHAYDHGYRKSPRQPKSYAQPSASFPAYDTISPDAVGITEVWETRQVPPSASSGSSLVQLVQAAVNQTRKLDARTLRLEKALKTKHQCWNKYVSDMRQSYRKERERHQQHCQKLEEELREAVAQQQSAHKQLSVFMPQLQQSSTEQDDGWNSAIGDEEMAPVLRNPLHELGQFLAAAQSAGGLPAGEGDPLHMMGAAAPSSFGPAPVTPPHRPNFGVPVTPPSGPVAAKDPYISSPASTSLTGDGTGHPPAERVDTKGHPSPPSASGQRPYRAHRRPPSQEVPRKSIKEASKSHSPVTDPKRSTLGDKLLERRQKELEAQHPEPPMPLPPEAAATLAGSGGGPGAIPAPVILEDDDELDEVDLFASDGELKTME